jgi:hypothetical protein
MYINKIDRWVPAQVALNAQNEVVGVMYTGKGTNTFPNIKTPVQVNERVREPTAPLILDNKVHADMVRKIYKDVQGY